MWNIVIWIRFNFFNNIISSFTQQNLLFNFVCSKVRKVFQKT